MRVPLLLAAAGLIASLPFTRVGASHPPSRQGRTADARAVERVLRDWYAASERGDSAAYAQAMLPEFVLVEDTTLYDRAGLLRLMFGAPLGGTDRATLRDFRTEVQGDVAWTTFRNDEVFTPEGKPPMPVRRYLETVVFRRVGGAWRMARYHATRINRTAPRTP